MRTQDEIVARLREIKPDDFLGFQSSDLCAFLTFERAKEFIRAEKHAEFEAEWGARPLSDEAVISEIKEYLPFAYEKCVGHRGLSANRSVDHFRAWFWLLGDDEMVEFAEDESNYAMYGAPVIRKAAERVGVTLDVSPEFERMAAGLHCGDSDCTGCRC